MKESQVESEGKASGYVEVTKELEHKLDNILNYYEIRSKEAGSTWTGAKIDKVFRQYILRLMDKELMARKEALGEEETAQQIEIKLKKRTPEEREQYYVQKIIALEKKLRELRTSQNDKAKEESESYGYLTKDQMQFYRDSLGEDRQFTHFEVFVKREIQSMKEALTEKEEKIKELEKKIQEEQESSWFLVDESRDNFQKIAKLEEALSIEKAKRMGMRGLEEVGVQLLKEQIAKQQKVIEVLENAMGELNGPYSSWVDEIVEKALTQVEQLRRENAN